MYRITSRAALTGPIRTANTSQHIVKPGETLSKIARDHGVSLEALIRANPQISNPNLIFPGQVIHIPDAQGAAPSPETPAPSSEPRTYTIRRGDNLSTVARRHGVTLNELLAANPQIRNPHLVHPGDKIRLPENARNPVGNSRSPVGHNGGVDPRTVHPGLRGADETLANQRTADGPGDYPRLSVYPPGSPEQVALFRAAARVAGVPESWAESHGLKMLLRAESGGRVGVPNYTYGARARDPSKWPEIHEELKRGLITARSSATGLGQLLLSNVERYYPSGRQGIGDPLEEAVGMLRYIKDRYGHPDTAWRLYNTRHEGY